MCPHTKLARQMRTRDGCIDGAAQLRCLRGLWSAGVQTGDTHTEIYRKRSEERDGEEGEWRDIDRQTDR